MKQYILPTAATLLALPTLISAHAGHQHTISFDATTGIIIGISIALIALITKKISNQSEK